MIELEGSRILLNCGPGAKKAISEEDRKKVDVVIATGSFMNAYCLGLFPHAQILLGRDLAAPDSAYTGDHIKDEVVQLGSAIRLEFAGKILSTCVLLDDGRQEVISSRLCGSK
uniref:GMC_OxRdtase_N domain-containing protein n=1 Tax=Steinernema glaseri TaxID=37863 RepID=A0A1I7Z5H9_9BILA